MVSEILSWIKCRPLFKPPYRGGQDFGVMRYENQERFARPAFTPHIIGGQIAAGFLASILEAPCDTRPNSIDLMNAGKSLDEILAAKPLADLNERYGDSAQFIDRVYTSLAKKM